jgi:DNA-binding CsgD family transcriptional regulator
MNFRFNTDSWIVFSIFFLSFLSLFVFSFITLPYYLRRKHRKRTLERRRKVTEKWESIEKKYSEKQIIDLQIQNTTLLVDLKSQLITLIESNPKETDLALFFFDFEKVYPSFGGAMQRLISEVTANEIRLCILIRLSLSSKEIAKLLGISAESVNKARYRLRKKIGLTSDDDLYSLLLNL